ncbi:isoprenoid synthase domain-containing protein [Trichoderma camerunense]
MTLAYSPTYMTTRSEAGYYQPGELVDSNHKTASDSGTSLSDETVQTIDSSVTSNSAEKMEVHNHEEDNMTQYMNESSTIRDYPIDSVYSRHLPALSTTVISAPALYVESMPGKKIRDKAALAINIWLQVNEEDLLQIRHIISLLHNASLILDDVEDGSTSRRGRPSTHLVFGIPQAINSAGYQINKAIMEVLKLGSSECLEIFSEEMDKLYIGQGHDLFWTFNTKLPTTEEYISMVDYKTGALFNMLVRLMAAKTQTTPPVTPDLNHLIILLGRYFQIRDDYMNLTSGEYTDQKGFCDDLDEGKFSLALIHALENTTEKENSIIRHILAQRHIANGMSLSQKHLVLDILKAAGSLDYTVTALRKIGQEIDFEIDSIEEVTGVENKPLRTLLGMLKV